MFSREGELGRAVHDGDSETSSQADGLDIRNRPSKEQQRAMGYMDDVSLRSMPRNVGAIKAALAFAEENLDVEIPDIRNADEGLCREVIQELIVSAKKAPATKRKHLYQVISLLDDGCHVLGSALRMDIRNKMKIATKQMNYKLLMDEILRNEVGFLFFCSRSGVKIQKNPWDDENLGRYQLVNLTSHEADDTLRSTLSDEYVDTRFSVGEGKVASVQMFLKLVADNPSGNGVDVADDKSQQHNWLVDAILKPTDRRRFIVTNLKYEKIFENMILTMDSLYVNGSFLTPEDMGRDLAYSVFKDREVANEILNPEEGKFPRIALETYVGSDDRYDRIIESMEDCMHRCDYGSSDMIDAFLAKGGWMDQILAGECVLDANLEYQGIRGLHAYLFYLAGAIVSLCDPSSSTKKRFFDENFPFGFIIFGPANSGKSTMMDSFTVFRPEDHVMRMPTNHNQGFPWQHVEAYHRQIFFDDTGANAIKIFTNDTMKLMMEGKMVNKEKKRMDGDAKHADHWLMFTSNDNDPFSCKNNKSDITALTRRLVAFEFNNDIKRMMQGGTVEEIGRRDQFLNKVVKPNSGQILRKMDAVLRSLMVLNLSGDIAGLASGVNKAFGGTEMRDTLAKKLGESATSVSFFMRESAWNSMAFGPDLYMRKEDLVNKIYGDYLVLEANNGSSDAASVGSGGNSSEKKTMDLKRYISDQIDTYFSDRLIVVLEKDGPSGKFCLLQDRIGTFEYDRQKYTIVDLCLKNGKMPPLGGSADAGDVVGMMEQFFELPEVHGEWILGMCPMEYETYSNFKSKIQMYTPKRGYYPTPCISGVEARHLISMRVRARPTFGVLVEEMMEREVCREWPVAPVCRNENRNRTRRLSQLSQDSQGLLLSQEQNQEPFEMSQGTKLRKRSRATATRFEHSPSPEKDDGSDDMSDSSSQDFDSQGHLFAEDAAYVTPSPPKRGRTVGQDSVVHSIPSSPDRLEDDFDDYDDFE